ncbi:DUF5671 domain-containing protein [Sinomonas halotolerans]|uniref:DUF5671 domain-containing protein n=1 Tax=Sinomonas halotolerans TaxID=1644133 RepID=A0ABU9X4K1_9MICC
MSTATAAVRRIIVYLLLAALVVIAASGLSGLLAMALDTGTVLAGTRTRELALSLAFTVIGGPLAGLLWWFVWRRLPDRSERDSVGWGLYVSALYTVSLAIGASQLLALVAALIRGELQDWEDMVAGGLVWSAVWAWHRWMARHPERGPLRLRTVPTVLGGLYGLILGAIMGAVALTALGRQALTALLDLPAPVGEGTVWWRSVLASAVWSAGGVGVWAWHWLREGGKHLRTAFSDVALIGAGIFAAAVAALGGMGTALFTVLRLLFDRGTEDALASLLAPLPPALAAAAVGWLVWAYHRPLVHGRSEAAQQAARLVTSAVALAGAASGIGVIINATLSLATPTLAGANARTLLLGGIAALAVGGPVWWLVWKPTTVLSEPLTAKPPGRRVYLVVVFGASAVAALVTLLVIGYQVFQSVLGVLDVPLVSRVRAPLGVLVATALVAGYHFAVWRHDRAVLSAERREVPRVGRVVLVTALDPDPYAHAIADSTGAVVTAWRQAAQPAAALMATPAPASEPAPRAEDVVRALEGLTARRVLVLVGPGPRVEAVPLAD